MFLFHRSSPIAVNARPSSRRDMASHIDFKFPSSASPPIISPVSWVKCNPEERPRWSWSKQAELSASCSPTNRLLNLYSLTSSRESYRQRQYATLSGSRQLTGITYFPHVRAAEWLVLLCLCSALTVVPIAASILPNLCHLRGLSRPPLAALGRSKLLWAQREPSLGEGKGGRT